MGRKSKAKGYDGEREVVLICRAHNMPAERKFMSGMFDPMGTDVVIGTGDDSKNVSVKRRANGMEWAYRELERADYVLFRADRRDWIKIEFWGPGQHKLLNALMGEKGS